MGTLKTTNIQSISGSGTVTLGVSGETFDIPSGVTLDSTGATITGALTNTPAVFAVLAGDQSISTASWTKVLIATEKWDTDGTFASNKFTPAVAGKYLFTYGYSGDVVDDAERIDMQLYKNGVAYNFGYIQNSGVATNTPMGNMGSVPVEMNTTDYVELYIYQNSGDTLTLYANRTTFSAMKIIGA